MTGASDGRMSDDPYAALGVAKTATQDEIRKAYKKIAKESHPDLNPGDTKAPAGSRRPSAAYDLLKDPEKRGRFDAGEIDASGQERPERRFYREYAEGPEATYHTSRGYEDFGDYLRRIRRPVRPARRAAARAARASGCAAPIGTTRSRSASSRRRAAPPGGSPCPTAACST